MKNKAAEQITDCILKSMNIYYQPELECLHYDLDNDWTNTFDQVNKTRLRRLITNAFKMKKRLKQMKQEITRLEQSLFKKQISGLK